jgi:HEAT repeat protein
MQWWNSQRLKSKNARTRRAAVEKLAERPSAEVLHLLAAALEDSDVEIRRVAVRGLGRSAEANAIHPLFAALHDQAGEVREAAIVALREMGYTDAIPVLLEMLQDQYPAARLQAAKTLERFGWKPQNGAERALRDAALGQFINAAQAGLPVLEMLAKALASGERKSCRCCWMLCGIRIRAFKSRRWKR